MSRYPKDVLAPGWQNAGKPTTTELPAEFGMVLEDPTSGFVGAKPDAWTRWVLDMLGYQPGDDEVDDLFPGSGAVAPAAAVLM